MNLDDRFSRKWIESPGTVLVAHNYYQLRGGEDVTFETEVSAMRRLGWDVYTIECSNHEVDDSSKLKVAVQTTWNASMAARLQRKIEEVKPSILHVHNFFPVMSPSIHWTAKRNGVAVVQTLHNFRLGCIGGTLFRDGHICTDCIGKLPIKGVMHKCYRDSIAGSTVVFGMLAAHRMLRTWQSKVDVFVCQTESFRSQISQCGLPANKLKVRPAMLAPDPGIGDGTGDYCLFVGRFSPEKGLLSLLKAWELDPGLPALVLVGSGPLELEVKDLANRDPRIRTTGQLQKEEVFKLLKDAKALVFPSEWFETFGLVLLEAIACGTPVATSDVGTPHDILGDGPHVEYFERGNPASIAAAIQRLIGDSDSTGARRKSARSLFEERFEESKSMASLAEIYDEARRTAALTPQAKS